MHDIEVHKLAMNKRLQYIIPLSLMHSLHHHHHHHRHTSHIRTCEAASDDDAARAGITVKRRVVLQRVLTTVTTSVRHNHSAYACMYSNTRIMPTAT